jgi:hypothetical protein
MKIDLTIEERRYLNALLLTVAYRTPNLPRTQKRTLKKIASKMAAHQPNLKPMERISIFHLLAVGAGVLTKQREEAAADEEKLKAINEKTALVSALIEKLGVTNEKPSEADPQPDTEHAGNG